MPSASQVRYDAPSPHLRCNTPLLPHKIAVESKTRTYHRRVGAGRCTAEQQGGVGLGRTGRQQICPPKSQPSLLQIMAS